ncbi:GtrA family protein [Hydrogenovibrio kuenenii]|uniref:GtrA family protein n=1 Tax=Hydrogenovibrio kuenenii TaxID=63658 RepID=UPI00046476FC|nr:GtrA family protein [Hydrogenovibrio kuenenii]
MVSNIFDKRIISFILVGILNTIFGYSLFSYFIYLGIYYPISVLLATILGVLFNFKTIGRLVFGHRDHSRIFHFIAVYTVIYVINVLGLWGMEQYGLYNKYIAGAILLIPLALLSFVLNKKYVFNQVNV